MDENIEMDINFIVKKLDDIEKRSKELPLELKVISFNFFSIIIIGFLLGFFTNLYADFIYDRYKSFWYFEIVVQLFILIILISVYFKFKNTYLEPREKEVEEMRKILREFKKDLQKKLAELPLQK